eukprot:1441040-Rhodomonas_salina.2
MWLCNQSQQRQYRQDSAVVACVCFFCGLDLTCRQCDGQGGRLDSPTVWWSGLSKSWYGDTTAAISPNAAHACHRSTRSLCQN